VPGSAIHVHISYITWTSSHSAQIVLKREIIVDYIICVRHPHSLYNKRKEYHLPLPESLPRTINLIATCNPNISDQVPLITGAPLAAHNREHG
jgi:hypothetical protein